MLLLKLKPVYYSTFFSICFALTFMTGGVKSKGCTEKAILYEENKLELEKISHLSSTDKNKYRDFVAETCQESCDYFMSPIPKRVSIRELTGNPVSEKIMPPFIVLHRCDPLCTYRPIIEDVEVVVRVYEVARRNKKYYKLTFKNHTSCDG